MGLRQVDGPGPLLAATDEGVARLRGFSYRSVLVARGVGCTLPRHVTCTVVRHTDVDLLSWLRLYGKIPEISIIFSNV